MNRDYFWLTDAQFAKIAPHLPRDTRGKPRVDDRRVISGIVHVLKSGGRWVDAPDVYGPRKTLYNRFVRWSRLGVFTRIFRDLAQPGAEGDTIMIDSTHLKAHRTAASLKKGGRGRGRSDATVPAAG